MLKDKVVRVRVETELHEWVKTAADAAHLSVSAYIRVMLLGRKLREEATPEAFIEDQQGLDL